MHHSTQRAASEVLLVSLIGGILVAVSGAVFLKSRNVQKQTQQLGASVQASNLNESALSLAAQLFSTQRLQVDTAGHVSVNGSNPTNANWTVDNSGTASAILRVVNCAPASLNQVLGGMYGPAVSPPALSTATCTAGGKTLKTVTTLVKFNGVSSAGCSGGRKINTYATTIVNDPTAGLSNFSVRTPTAGGYVRIPVVGSSGSWTAIASMARKRYFAPAVFTGKSPSALAALRNKMLVFGGYIDPVSAGSCGANKMVYANELWAYDPAANSWDYSLPNFPGYSGVLERRIDFRMVWTGETGNSATSNRLIMYGGVKNTGEPGCNAGGGDRVLNDGMIYNGNTNSWDTTVAALKSTAASPPAPGRRSQYYAAWTGDTGDPSTEYRMLVWGGCSPASSANMGAINGVCTDTSTGINYLSNNGAVLNYNTSTANWQWTSIPSAPISGRNSPWPINVWTGRYFVVFSGLNSSGTFLNDGAIYDLKTNTWYPLSGPSFSGWAGKHAATGVLTKNNKIIIFAGQQGAVETKTGAILDVTNPATPTWTQMTTVNAPVGRHYHIAYWTGDAMLVWGGFAGSTRAGTGACYDPVADQWTSIVTPTVINGRTGFVSVWTGDSGSSATTDSMIIVGGEEDSPNKYMLTGAVFH